MFIDGIPERNNIFKDTYGGFLPGSVGFIQEKLKKLNIKSDEISYRKELNPGIEPDRIIEKVARRYKKNPEELVNSKIRSAIEKQIAMYLVRRYTGLTNGEIGKIFKMKARAVSKAGTKIERVMEENKNTGSQVKKLISNFRG